MVLYNSYMETSEDLNVFEAPPLHAIMGQLATKLPVNDLGLPEGIYRPDMLANILASTDLTSTRAVTAKTGSASVRTEQEPTPADELNPSDRTAVIDGETFEDVLEPPVLGPSSSLEIGSTLASRSAYVLAHLSGRVLAAAWVPFSYEEGFPCLPDGRPVWGQLEFEPVSAFQAFSAYQAQGREGVRQLSELTDQAGISQNLAGLRECFALYSWDVRVKAYDLFWMAERRRLREIRAMEVDDSHYLASIQMMEKAKTYIEGAEFDALMTPKTAIDLVTLASKMQRIAVGLPAQGPAVDDDKAQPTGAPMEVLIRNQLKRQGVTQKTTEDGLSDVVGFLDDEEDTDMIQEVIIKLGERP